MKQWLPSFMIAIIVSLVVRTYIVEAMVVPSGSMIPTIRIHDRIVVEKVMPVTEIHHGDIIVFYPPVKIEGAKRLVKRLIGMPGDIIEIKDGTLYRNNEKVIEPYVKEPMNYTYGPVSVPENEYFFLGDNRNDSFDSHAWDVPFVERKDLIGKVILNIPTHYLYQ
ncbi:signal peptidase I [Cohnella sp. AR92]|uniref:signal peptidase I n=1 Tax=Cohnella sp. AR92 TaxID=648716 RepID=UPI001EDD62D6|nr:signal peptidase I [Cohnella sp. AR92]